VIVVGLCFKWYTVYIAMMYIRIKGSSAALHVFRGSDVLL
jgi:hypothetical protein